MVYEIQEATPNYELVRVSRVQSMLRKFASTVSGSYLDLTIHTSSHSTPYGDPPAWSDGSSIGLYHPAILGKVTEVDNLVRLKGLTIHELGHVLFTPRRQSGLTKKVIDNGNWRAFNILEDNRIDNMMVARLSGVAPWLLHTVLKEFFEGENTNHEHLLPLLHGRKYIPQKIRDLSAQVYAQQGYVKSIQEIIDEYITLNLGRKNTHERAYQLVDSLHQLLHPASPNQHGIDTCSPPKNGGDDMSGVAEQQQALDASAKQQAKAADEESEETDESDTPSDSDSEGTGDGTPLSPTEELKEQLRKAHTDTATDMEADIKDMIRSMRNGSGVSSFGGGDQKVKPSEGTFMQVVSPEMVSNAREFTRVLTELKSLFDPAWVSKQAEGKLNARDFLMGSPLDEAFDMWDDGKSDASDIECVVLQDISGSMGNVMKEAFDAMWGIKRGLDSINASTTVITFGDYSRVLYSADSRATLQKRVSYDGSGATNPTEGIAHARSILASSARALKLFVVITDGWWPDAERNETLISEIKQLGALTGMVFLSNSWESADERVIKVPTHGCEVVAVLDTPHEITGFARQLVHLQQQRMINS